MVGHVARVHALIVDVASVRVVGVGRICGIVEGRHRHIGVAVRIRSSPRVAAVATVGAAASAGAVLAGAVAGSADAAVGVGSRRVHRLGLGGRRQHGHHVGLVDGGVAGASAEAGGAAAAQPVGAGRRGGGVAAVGQAVGAVQAGAVGDGRRCGGCGRLQRVGRRLRRDASLIPELVGRIHFENWPLQEHTLLHSVRHGNVQRVVVRGLLVGGVAEVRKMLAVEGTQIQRRRGDRRGRTSRTRGEARSDTLAIFKVEMISHL